jgi:hypothetical protein
MSQAHAAPRTPILVVILLVVVTVASPGLWGQEQGSIVGTVLDQATAGPLDGVTVRIEGGPSATVTDPQGAFNFSSVPVGSLVIRVDRPGYASVVEGISITAGEVALVQFELFPLSFLLDELRVTVDRDEAAGRSRGHTQGEIDAGRLTEASTALDLLSNRIPGLLIYRGGEVGSPTTVYLRGTSSATQSNAPAVYLNGVRMSDDIEHSFQMLQDIPAVEVRRIHVLRGPAASARYMDAVNGVILIELRSARSTDSPHDK